MVFVHHRTPGQARRILAPCLQEFDGVTSATRSVMPAGAHGNAATAWQGIGSSASSLQPPSSRSLTGLCQQRGGERVAHSNELKAASHLPVAVAHA